MELDYSEKLMATQLSDLEQIPDTPNRRAHHRRAQSETFIRFPSFDDDSFLDDVVFDFPAAPSLSSDNNYTPLLQQQPAINGLEIAQEQAQAMKSIEKTHFRSLSVDANFFEGLNFGPSSSSSADGGGGVTASGGPRHRYSSSMDGSAVMSSFEAMVVDPSKKATGADRLQELALIDPKRAKRILSNRQSAARSKERKVQYTSELEKKVQTLQTEATTLSAQVTVLQRDTTGLTNENKELKMRLQALEQQAHLRDALNETLREEVQRLKIAAGQVLSSNGNNFNSGPRPQFSYQQQHGFLNFGGGNHIGHHPHQQQQQIRAQHSNQNISEFNTQLKPSFSDFNQKV